MVVVVVWESNQHSGFVLCLLFCLYGEYTCLFIMFDSIIQLLSIVRFVMPASVFYQVHSEKWFELFSVTYSGFPVSCTQPTEKFYYKPVALMETVHIKGAFWGAELARYQEPQTREPLTYKIFQIPENYSILPACSR